MRVLININHFNFRRKWLPQQLRKLSQSKTDKLTIEKSQNKKTDKKKDKSKEDNEETLNVSAASSSLTNNSSSYHQDEIEDVFECPELPPPMKPVKEQPILDGSSFTRESNLSEIEQFIKEKMVKLV